MANKHDAGALRIQYWPLARLVPSPRNARTHSDAQVAELVGVIRTFGFTNPILVGEEGDVIAGHARLMAARQLAMPKVPVIVLAGLSELQRRQLMLADNKLALNSGWDEALLSVELADLRGAGVDIAALGFQVAEIDKLLSRGQAVDDAEEATPEVPEVPVSRLGDVWQLGPHRIACGDSSDPLAVRKLLATQAPKLMVTDPPYGVEYDADWRNKAMRKSGKPIGGRAIGKVRNDHRADWRSAWKLFPGDVGYVWHASTFASTVQASLEAVGFQLRWQIVWAKGRFVIGRGDYHPQHELCWYVVRDGAPSHWTGDRSQTTLWQIDHSKSETGHSTQKPVECMRRPMLNNSKPGATVYDPFLGSGTTIIAAESCERVGLGMELEPGYVDVGVQRWQEFTGKRALLQGDGREFAAVAAARQRPAPRRAAKGAKRGKPAAPSRDFTGGTDRRSGGTDHRSDGPAPEPDGYDGAKDAMASTELAWAELAKRKAAGKAA